MKHATPVFLDQFENLLEGIREIPGLTEKKKGIFYKKSKAFLHFHEDGNRLFAEVRFDGIEFERAEVTTKKQQSALLK